MYDQFEKNEKVHEMGMKFTSIQLQHFIVDDSKEVIFEIIPRLLYYNTIVATLSEAQTSEQ